MKKTIIVGLVCFLIASASVFSSHIFSSRSQQSMEAMIGTDNKSRVPIAYGATGTAISSPHIVQGSCTLGTDCAITLTNSAVFTSSTSYTCAAQDGTAAAATKIVQSTGAAFTITGTGTDALRYICYGS